MACDSSARLECEGSRRRSRGIWRPCLSPGHVHHDFLATRRGPVRRAGQVSPNLSIVSIINNPSLSFTAKTENGAVGVVRGTGTGLNLSNVLLSENIKSSELVLTKGDVNSDGIGIPQDLIVGKIISVEKNASDLFQKGKLESFVNFTTLSLVFVYIQNQ